MRQFKFAAYVLIALLLITCAIVPASKNMQVGPSNTVVDIVDKDCF